MNLNGANLSLEKWMGLNLQENDLVAGALRLGDGGYVTGVNGARIELTGSLNPQGTTYYVSASQGSDGNNGLSEGAAFASWNRAMEVIGPNVRVLFQRGDQWVLDSDTTLQANGGEIGAYGTGPRPILQMEDSGGGFHFRTSGSLRDVILQFGP
jgi:hypothetical protein